MTPDLTPAGDAGRAVILSGNEAVARGALEAGVHYCTSYPGAPASEILQTLISKAPNHGLYPEWSVNEKVALEGAAAASFAGLRALCAMKANGLNVAADFLMSLATTGIGGGLVVVVCDDPQGHSSTNEQDSRYYAVLADIPLLEPSTFQEAKDMAREAFAWSERLGLPVLIRSVTRIAHARGRVVLGPLEPVRRQARFDRSRRFICWPVYHPDHHRRMTAARTLSEEAPFNKYWGPPSPRTLIITSGTGWLYSREAVTTLGCEDGVGILKIGVTWPLPERLLLTHLEGREKVLFLEEVEPFLERNVRSLAAQYTARIGPVTFYGKDSGHVAGSAGPALGESDPDQVMAALARVHDLPSPGRNHVRSARERDTPATGSVTDLPPRELAFCAGCPHRASFWTVKAALELDGREGFVVGDIGCYSLGIGQTGYRLLSTLHCMGSGPGLASGFGRLAAFGFQQPVVSFIGDSTFFHAGIPALVNARYAGSDLLCVVLDNGATAMTGFQPHPGTGTNALGDPAPRVDIERVCQALDLPVEIADPFAVDATIETICRLLREPGAKVLILRQECALVATKRDQRPRYVVDQSLCIGDDCGCARFCTRAFGCPANIWDAGAGKARIDEVVCTGCGVCASLCPRGAITREAAPEGGPDESCGNH